ncbi:hypothetical protein SAMN06265376_102420 [Dokdonia pacifica]|uniref:Uncharacterized protein n=1 Tax=Dokdonia pacifica TaxID=1627892 RepID=A0A238YXZ2_9FLAO|nr:hypothetical protein SAMN06265376_102420 [Dokdonia pacifica]
MGKQNDRIVIHTPTEKEIQYYEKIKKLTKD